MWHTFFVYAFLLALLRLFARRLLSELTTLDLLMVLMLGSAVETSMVLASTTVRAGLASAVTLLVTNWIVTKLYHKYGWFRIAVGGQPMLIVHEGAFVEKNLHRLGLSHEDVMQAVREREQGELSNIRFAVFEPDGEINIVPKNAGVHCAHLKEALRAAGG